MVTKGLRFAVKKNKITDFKEAKYPIHKAKKTHLDAVYKF